MKEILNDLIDIFIIHTELSEINKAKNEAVKDQKFEEAVTLREQELELIKKLPTLGYLKELKFNLNNVKTQ